MNEWTHLHHSFAEHQLDNKIEFYSNGRHRVRQMLNALQLDSYLIIYGARFAWTIAEAI